MVQKFSGYKKAAKIFSDIFNPLVALGAFFIYNGLSLPRAEFISELLSLFFIVFLPVSIWIFWNVKKGNYSNSDVSDRNQRKSLYFFIEACLLAFLLYNYFVRNSVDIALLFVLILLVALQLSNYFIKSSMHMAFNTYVAALFFAINPTIGFVWLIIAVLVGMTRVIIKRHTVAEVLSGAVIAVAVSAGYLYTFIQLKH